MATVTQIGATSSSWAPNVVNDGGDLAVVAKMNIHQVRKKWRWLVFRLVVFVVLLFGSAAVDIGVIKGLLTARFSDEFGIVADGQDVWIWLSSAVTVCSLAG